MSDLVKTKRRFFALGALSVLILAALVILVKAFFFPAIPRADNVTPPEELIKHRYKDYHLFRLAEGVSVGPEFFSLKDISRYFKIECYRDMSEYGDRFGFETLSYIMLMGEEGGRVYVFFYDDGKVLDAVYMSEIPSHESIVEVLEGKITPSFWNRKFFVKYSLLLYDHSIHRYRYQIFTKEGIVSLFSPYPISEEQSEWSSEYNTFELFYDDIIFADEVESDVEYKLYGMLPILPIDKGS